MEDLIKRSDAIAALVQECIDSEIKFRSRIPTSEEIEEYRAIAKRIFEQIPTVEREHGEWIESDNGWNCSSCGYGVTAWNNTPFCPNCGADMRSENNG